MYKIMLEQIEMHRHAVAYMHTFLKHHLMAAGCCCSGCHSQSPSAVQLLQFQAPAEAKGGEGELMLGAGGW